MPLSSRSTTTGKEAAPAPTFQWLGPTTAEEYYAPKPAPAPAAQPLGPIGPLAVSSGLSSRSGEGQTVVSAKEPQPKPAPAQEVKLANTPIKTPGAAKKFDTAEAERAYVQTLTTQEARHYFGDAWGKMGYSESKARGAMDVYKSRLIPFQYERDAAKEYYRKLATVPPEEQGIVAGEGFWTRTAKAALQNTAELGIDGAELLGLAFAPDQAYPLMKQMTIATRRQLGIPEDKIASEASRLRKQDEFAQMGGDVKNMVTSMYDGFKTSITGMATWAKLTAKGDNAAAADVSSQMAFDLRQGLSSFGGLGDKVRQTWGVSADKEVVYVKGQKVRDLTDPEKEVAGGMQAVGGLVNSVALWSKLSPWIEKGVIATNAAKLAPLAESHPILFRGIITNAVEETSQALVSGIVGVPYNFGDTVFGLGTQFLMTSVGGIRSDIPELKDVDVEAAMKNADDAAQAFVVQNQRAPSPLELQQILGDQMVPGTRTTWNEANKIMAKRYGQEFGENRLVYLDSLEKFGKATPEVKIEDPALKGLVEERAAALGTNVDDLVAIVRDAGDSMDDIDAALRSEFGEKYDSAVSKAVEAAANGEGSLDMVDFKDPLRRAAFGMLPPLTAPEAKFAKDLVKAGADPVLAARAHEIIGDGQVRKVDYMGHNDIEAVDRTFDVPKMSIDELKANPPTKIGDLEVDPESIKMVFDDGETGIKGKIQNPIQIFYDLETGKFSVQNGYHRLVETIARGDAKINGEVAFGKKTGDSFYVMPENTRLMTVPEVRAALPAPKDLAPRKVETARVEEKVDVPKEEEPARVPSLPEAEKMIERSGGFARIDEAPLPAKNAYASQELAQSLGLSRQFLYDNATRNGIDLTTNLRQLDALEDPMQRALYSTQLIDTVSKPRPAPAGLSSRHPEALKTQLPQRTVTPSERLDLLQRATDIERNVMPFNDDAGARAAEALDLRRQAIPELFDTDLPARIFDEPKRTDGLIPLSRELLDNMGDLGRKWGGLQERILDLEKDLSRSLPVTRTAMTQELGRQLARTGNITKAQARAQANGLGNLALLRRVVNGGGYPELARLLQNYETLRSLHEGIATTAKRAQEDRGTERGGSAIRKGRGDAAGGKGNEAKPAKKQVASGGPGKGSKNGGKGDGGGKEPPKASSASGGDSKRSGLSSRKKPAKQPKPLNETQPERTSRLRDRLKEETARVPDPTAAGIMKFLQEEFTAPIRIGKNSKGSLGTFYPDKNVIRIKDALNIETSAHEIGHYLDNEYGILNAVRDGKKFIEPHRTELLNLGERTSKPSYTTAEKIQEGIAEFVRRYIAQPESLDIMAPNFKKFFEGQMPKEAIRMFEAVRDAHTKLMAESPEYRVKSHISTEQPKAPIGERVQKATDSFFAAIDDDLLMLRKYTKQAEKMTGRDIPFKNDPYVLARLVRGLDGKTLQFLGPNLRPFDGEGKPIDQRSLGTILEDVGARRSDFEAYLVAKRAQDLHKQEIKTGIIPADADAVVKLMQERHSDFPALQKEIVSWNRSLLNYAQQRGFLSGEQVKNMTENGDNYVPFFRVIDELTVKGNARKKLADVANPFKKIKGSTRQIISPIESMTKNAYVIMSAVERNRVGQAIVKLAQEHPDLGAYIEKIPSGSKPVTLNVEDVMKKLGIEEATNAGQETITLFVHGSKPNVAGENIMMVVDDGKAGYYSVDPMLYKAITAMSDENGNILMRMLSAPASLLRAGATLTPEFIGRNPLRDQISAGIYSRANYIPYLDLVRGIVETIRKGDDYQRAATGGAMQAAFVSMDRGSLKNHTDRIFATKGERAAHFFTHPLDALRALSEFGEMGTRIGESRKVFAKEMKRSGDFEEAMTKSAFAARNITLDFSRRGWAGKSMNQITAFWNATVQDISKFGRELSGREKGGNPAAVAMKAVALITIPSIAFYEMSKNDERYQELPRWQKDYFWIAALPGMPLIRIPKPFLPGMIFGSLVTRSLEAADKNDIQPLRDFFVSLRESTIPGITPTAMLPIIEYATNHSMFFGRDIVPFDQQRLLPEDQYGIYTGEIYKELGDRLHVSPLKIESLVYGYTAGLGRYASGMIDFIGAKTDLLPEKPVAPEDITQYPLIKAFTISDLSTTGESLNTFYEQYSRAEKVHYSLNEAIKKQDRDRAREIRDGNMQDLIYVTPDGSPQLVYDALGAVATLLSDLRKERETVITSKELDAGEKTEHLMKLNAAMRMLARRALMVTRQRPESIDNLRSIVGE